MNITNVLHRSRTGGIGAASPRATRTVDPPASAVPPRVFSLERGVRDGGGGGGGGRHRGNVVLVALLATAALSGAIGTAVGFASGSDDTTERQLRSQVATLTSERGDAVEELAALDVELTSLQEQLGLVEADADGLAGQVGALRSRIASLSEQRADAQASVDALDAELGLTQQRLTETQQRLSDVTADRDAFVRLFPLSFDPSLDAVDTAGVYRVSPTWIYCAGLATCGATPTMSDLTIRSTPEGYLRANIPGLVEGGLFRADGAFHLVADSTVAVPTCAGATRTAGVTMTIYPSGMEAGRDGVGTVTGLNAVITVEAPAVGACPAVLAFANAELTARA